MGYALKVTLDCNGGCGSCYEAAIRKRKKTPYDIGKIEAALDLIIKEEVEAESANPGQRKTSPPTFHGGEPLLMKKKDFERLAKKIYRHWGRNSIQTNGTLIDTEFIELFLKYNFSVGISLDGDTADLNMGRWNLNPEIAKEKTELVLENMKRLQKAKISLSIIALLRKYNAAPDRIDDFIAFLDRMESEFGIRSIRTNPVIVYEDRFRQDEELLGDDLGNALIKVADWTMEDHKRRTYPARDVIEMLFGYDHAVCAFGECDVFKTSAELPINHLGELTNCLHGGAATEGIQILQAEKKSDIRYRALIQTPQDLNGCKDCHFWHICHGGCPGAGVDNDWRNRTRFCSAYKMLFRHISDKIKGLIPNMGLPQEFQPDAGSPKRMQFNLGEGGSTYRNETRKNREDIRRATKAEDQKRGGKTNRHGDKPHGDHTDQVLLKGRK